MAQNILTSGFPFSAGRLMYNHFKSAASYEIRSRAVFSLPSVEDRQELSIYDDVDSGTLQSFTVRLSSGPHVWCPCARACLSYVLVPLSVEFSLMFRVRSGISPVVYCIPFVFILSSVLAGVPPGKHAVLHHAGGAGERAERSHVRHGERHEQRRYVIACVPDLRLSSTRVFSLSVPSCRGHDFVAAAHLQPHPSSSHHYRAHRDHLGCGRHGVIHAWWWEGWGIKPERGGGGDGGTCYTRRRNRNCLFVRDVSPCAVSSDRTRMSKTSHA